MEDVRDDRFWTTGSKSNGCNVVAAAMSQLNKASRPNDSCRLGTKSTFLSLLSRNVDVEGWVVDGC